MGGSLPVNLKVTQVAGAFGLRDEIPRDLLAALFCPPFPSGTAVLTGASQRAWNRRRRQVQPETCGRS